MIFVKKTVYSCPLKTFQLKTPFTLFFGLINAISTSWRLVSQNTLSRCPESEKKEEIISTKYVYNLLLKKIFVPPTAETKISKHGLIHSGNHPKNIRITFPDQV